MTMTSKQIVKHLKKNGFKYHRQGKGSHTIYINDNGITVPVPMHNKDLPIGTERGILKQAGL